MALIYILHLANRILSELLKKQSLVSKTLLFNLK